MKLENFKAGVWRSQYRYKSFLPCRVDQPWTWEDPTIDLLLEKASRALGELNAFSLIIPDVDLFIRMHVMKEAQSSSRIEGTETGLDEALLSEEQVRPVSSASAYPPPGRRSMFSTGIPSSSSLSYRRSLSCPSQPRLRWFETSNG